MDGNKILTLNRNPNFKCRNAEIGTLPSCWIREGWAIRPINRACLGLLLYLIDRILQLNWRVSGLVGHLSSVKPCQHKSEWSFIDVLGSTVQWQGCMGERKSECLDHTEGNISVHANVHLLQVWKHQGGHLSPRLKACEERTVLPGEISEQVVEQTTKWRGLVMELHNGLYKDIQTAFIIHSFIHWGSSSGIAFLILKLWSKI